ncbi:Bug family tripartite tricarboxylate transporter substrate binding protein [Pseudorhodoplanes sp.]|uniref:Bug family tripartite tricarboxylate transporter substrate binding protein n=1 Tax=Pseudorhodoplanes sp. TaxID=1934341 RepID=UPI003D0EF961
MIGRLLLVAASLLLGFSTVVTAQDYPTRPVTFIVPYPAGSSGDVLARVLGDRLSEKLGKGIVIDNRPGGAGIAATIAAANAAPDGYTMLLTGLNHTSNVGMFKSLPYDPVKSFTPVTLVGSVPVILVTNKKSGITSYEDLVAKAKQNPGKINFGSAGFGTGGHLATELMMQLNGIKMTHIPYKGATPALTDLLSGQIDVLFTGVPPTLEHIRAGTLVPLITSSAERVAGLPEVRTGREAGMKDFLVDVWFGLLAPVGTPAPIVDLLSKQIVEILGDPSVRAKLAVQGVLPTAGGPQAFQKRLQSDLDTWPKVMREAGIKPQ